MKRSKAETDTPIVPQMTVPQMLMMMQPYQLQNMLQLNASNGIIPSAGAQLPLPAKPPARAGAALTNVVASSEWRMEVCRYIVNLISIVKLSDLQFHMCVVNEILKKVS